MTRLYAGSRMNGRESGHDGLEPATGQIAVGPKADNLGTWMKIAKWYVDWRKRVEV